MYILISFSFFSVIAKQCEEYDKSECENYILSDSDDINKQCLYDYKKNKCQLKSCSKLTYENCHLYKLDNKEYQCVANANADGCEIKNLQIMM